MDLTFFQNETYKRDGNSNRAQREAKITYDLKSGEALIYWDRISNALYTTRYSLTTFIPHTFWNFFSRNASLFYIIVSFIMVFWEAVNPFLPWIYWVPFGFYFAIFLMKEILFDSFRLIYDFEQNNRQTMFCKPSSGELVEKKWKDLRLGNIIYLTKGDVAPCDVIVLDTNEITNKEAICYVQDDMVTGRSNMTLKKACSVTQIIKRDRRKNNFKEYKKILTGSVEYEYATKNINSFNGLIKLKKDPKKGVLSIENIILRGSKIRAGWIFALVAYTGEDLKVAKNYNILNTGKISNVERSTHFPFFMMIVFVLLLSCISLIISYAKSQNTTINPTDNNSWFTHLIVYTNLILISFYGFLDFCSILEKFRFENSSKTLTNSNKKNKKLIVNEGDVLTDLAHINHVFLDKTGTLTSDRVEISKIYVNDKIYEFGDRFNKKFKAQRSPSIKKARSQKNNEEELGNFQIPSFQSLLPMNKVFRIESPEEKQKLIQMGTLPLLMNKNEDPEFSTQSALPSKKNFLLSNMKETEENFFEDLEKEESLQELIKSFAFCHNARVVYEGTETSYYQSSRKEEEVLLEFARGTGFSLEQVTKSDMKGEYLIKTPEKKKTIPIIGTNEFSHLRKRFSLLMDTEEGSKLYCKGNLEAMKDSLLLEEEDLESLTMISNYFKEQGVKMMVYAGRKFNKSETQELSNRLRNLKFSLMSQEEELEELAKEMEVKLEILGIVGFKEKMRKEVPEMIRFFQDIEAGIWVVSGDTYNNVINCAVNAHILDSNKSEAFHIQAENIEDISVSIRNILTEIKMILDPFKKNNLNKASDDVFIKKNTVRPLDDMSFKKRKAFQNKYVVLNGKTLDIILKNVYLRDHFIFLASFTKVLIGYNLSPQNKQALVNIVRNNFVGNPNVLAIGDGLNDTQMMQSANVGIELLHKNKQNEYEISHNDGDILISNLDMIKPLMIFKGKDLYERIDRTMGIMIYKDVLICLTFFVYNWNYNFMNHQLYESYFVFFYEHIFFIFQILVFVLYNQKFQVEVLKSFPALYMDGAARINASIPKTYIKNLIEGLLISIIIIYVTSAILETSIDCNGKEVDFEGVQWVFVFSLFFIMGIKFIYNFSTNTKKVWVLMIASFFVAFAIFVAFISKYTSTLNYQSDFQLLKNYLTNNSNMWFAFFFNVLTASLFGYFNDVYLDKYFLPSLHDYFAVKNKGIMWNKQLVKLNGEPMEELLDNQSILAKTHREITVGEHINYIFKDLEVMDNLIYEMVNPFDINLIDLKVDKFSLKIIDFKLNSKYLTSRTPFLLTFYMKAHWFLALIFGIYSLISGLLGLSANYYSNLAIFMFFICYGLFFFTKTYKTLYYPSVYASSLFLLAALLYYQWTNLQVDESYTTCLMALVFTINFNLNLFYLLSLNLIYHLLMYIRLGVFYDEFDPMKNFTSFDVQFYVIFVYILLTLTLQLLNFLILYEDEKLRRNEFIADATLALERNIKQDILSILVPKFVKNYLEQGITHIQQNQDDVVVLFCDICDFDKIITTKGRRIVEMLDRLFRKFDNICIVHGLQKIETVGKTYMACAGIQASELEMSKHVLQVEKTKRVINASFDMMQEAEASNLKLKIGVHRGRIIAGVIGFHKPQFSLIGDTVNTTSRLCSTGEDGMITISANAFQAVKFTEFFFEMREVVAKGLGKIPTYQVSKVSKKTLFKTKMGKAMTLLKEKKVKMEESKKEFEKENSKEESETNLADATKKSSLDLIKKTFGKSYHKMRTTTILQEKVEINVETDPKDKEPKQIEMEDDSDEEEEVSQTFLDSKKILFSLFFPKDERIIEFYHDLEKNTNFNFRMILVMYSLVYFVHALILIRIKDFYPNYETLVGLRIVSAGLIASFHFLKKNLYSNNLAKLALFIVILFSFWISFYQGISYTSDLSFLQTFQLIEMSLTFTVVVYFPLFPIVFSLIFYFLQVVAFFILFSYGYGLTTDNVFYFFIYTTIHLMKIYQNKKSVIQRFNNTHIRARQRIEQEGLVSQLLPSHAFEKLKSINILSKYELTDQFEDVTLLFADIAGFTKFSSSVQPEEVVSMLRTLFTEFDKACLKNKVYKVYTIGDCYVVMGLTNIIKRNPVEEAKHVVRMGLSMIDIIKEVKQNIGFKDMNMRIGIHTGSLIGGIIGTDIVRYDIYGKDVVIANKMESNGVEGNIMISEATKVMLEKDKKSNFSFEFLKTVEIKGSDKPMKGYLILNAGEEAEEEKN